MTTTTRVEVTQAWVELIEATDVFVQLQDGGPILIHIAAVIPVADTATDHGMVLHAAGGGEGVANVAFSGIEALSKVFARSVNDETNTVEIIASGVA